MDWLTDCARGSLVDVSIHGLTMAVMYVWVCVCVGGGNWWLGWIDVCVGVVMGGAFALVPGLCMDEEVRSTGGLMG